MSLRFRVLLTILVVNLAACVALALVLFTEESQIRTFQEEVYRERHFRLVMDRLSDNIREEWRDSSDLEAFRRQVRNILGWQIWQRYFEDVIITDVEAGPLGGEIVVPAKICFSPLGSYNRAHPFDWERVQAGLKQAVRIKDVVAVGKGRCELIPVYRGQLPVGAIYYVPRIPPSQPYDLKTPLAILGGFTIVLLLALYLAISRALVGPLETLNEQVRAMAEGGDRDRITLIGGGKEVRSLAATFNDTMGRIRRFQQDLEAEVQRVTEEVRAKERQLVLSSRLAAMGTLAAGIAHEINNPLGGLINAARRIRKQVPDDPTLADYLEILEEGLDRIASVVRRVLEFSPRDLEPTLFPLLEPARRAAAFVEHRAERMGVALVVEGDETGLVWGDAREIQQVFLNLLMNGLDALEERIGAEGAAFGPRLLLTVEGRGDKVLARVVDNGPGLQPEQRDRIFDLFYTTKEAGRGTGMGLAICFAILRNHGGELQVESEPGGGFAIEVVLPAGAEEGA